MTKKPTFLTQQINHTNTKSPSFFIGKAIAWANKPFVRARVCIRDFCSVVFEKKARRLAITLGVNVGAIRFRMAK